MAALQKASPVRSGLPIPTEWNILKKSLFPRRDRPLWRRRMNGKRAPFTATEEHPTPIRYNSTARYDVLGCEDVQPLSNHAERTLRQPPRPSDGSILFPAEASQFLYII